MLHRLSTYRHFVKIEHTLFSFPLLLSGALLARHHSLSLRPLMLILLAGTGARTAALSLNRILDRRFDRDNPRTAGRELPRGAMAPREAWLITSVGTITYLLAAYLISPRCLMLAPLPLAIFVIYPLLNGPRGDGPRPPAPGHRRPPLRRAAKSFERRAGVLHDKLGPRFRGAGLRLCGRYRLRAMESLYAV